MSQADRDYELRVIKIAINSCFDKSVPLTSQSIDMLETNPDAVVWDLATKIYSQSGHKVELAMVRDIVISRILPMKSLLAEKERIAEERARQQQLAAEKARIAEEERARQQQLAAERARIAEEEDLKRFIAHLKTEFDVKISDKIVEKQHYLQEVFDRLKKVIIEELDVDVDEDEITPESEFSHYFDNYTDDYHNRELENFIYCSLYEEFGVMLEIGFNHVRKGYYYKEDADIELHLGECRLFGKIITTYFKKFTVDEFAKYIFVKLYG
jgi:hypothetical protein